MRPEKTNIVGEIQGKLGDSPFLMIAEYTGMTVPHFSELRKRLADVGSEIHVVKNTFLRIASKELNLPEFNIPLVGQNAMVTGEEDVCAAAKVLKTFHAEFEKPILKVGVLDNELLVPEQLQVLADLPSKDTLRATLLGVLMAPATKLVRVLNEPGASLARVLKAKADSMGA